MNNRMEKIHGLVRWTHQVTEDHCERVESVFDIDKDETITEVIKDARGLARISPDTELHIEIIVNSV